MGFPDFFCLVFGMPKLSASPRLRWLTQAPFASFPMIRISGQGGGGNQRDKAAENVGKVFCRGKKGGFVMEKEKTKGLKGKEYTGWLVEQFHFKICNVFSQQVAEGVHLPRLYVPSPCWGYNLSWRVFPGQPESFCLGVWSRSAVSGRRGTVLDLPVNPYDAFRKV